MSEFEKKFSEKELKFTFYFHMQERMGLVENSEVNRLFVATISYPILYIVTSIPPKVRDFKKLQNIWFHIWNQTDRACVIIIMICKIFPPNWDQKNLYDKYAEGFEHNGEQLNNSFQNCFLNHFNHTKLSYWYCIADYFVHYIA